MDPIVTTQIPAAFARPGPTEAEIAAASVALNELDREARALGTKAQAAPVHYAIGRVYFERLGDFHSAAVSFQNAFRLDPSFRPNLEAARRLFAGAGRPERAVVLHEREEQLLTSPVERAESLRAQALLLAGTDPEESGRRLQRALELAPDHPALLAAAVDAAERRGDLLEAARLLLRAAGALRDDVQKAVRLRRATRILGELARSGAQGDADLEALRAEAQGGLHAADPRDPEGILELVDRARATSDWEAVLRLYRERAERTASVSDRALVANLAAHRLGRAAEAMAEVTAALQDARRDPSLLALRVQLAEDLRSPELPDALRALAAASSEASERADLKSRAAELSSDPLEQEQLLSEALADNPGDAAAIALHARLVALRDAGAAADRFVALGEALAEHSGAEAAAHFVEAGAWLERAGRRAEASQAARKALSLARGEGPAAASALRLLQRTWASAANPSEMADLLEGAASRLPRAAAAEMLGRAAALLGGAEGSFSRALALAERASEMSRGLSSPRWLEIWTELSLRATDLPSFSRALEARAEANQGADAADLLVEAAEAARAALDDARATALLRKARAADPASEATRRGLLALPNLAAAERVELLSEEARGAEPARAAALHAERAALYEGLGQDDEAVAACAQALALAGADLAVLRRLARVQAKRGDHAAALAVLVQIAQALPEGPVRAQAHARAADYAEWRGGDEDRAAELRAAAGGSPGALASLARGLAWAGRAREAAEAFDQLAQRSDSPAEKADALRWAASLYAYRAGDPARAAEVYRRLLADAPDHLEAAAALVELTGKDTSPEARKERADLRAKLASRCQDPRCAALLRSESAEDRLLGGDRDQAIAEYRRALALNPQDRIALDAVESGLRLRGEPRLLAEHLAFRCAYAEGDTRAALSLEHAELLAEAGDYGSAQAAYAQALQTDPRSLFAVRGARRLAERTGDKQEQLRLLAREASLSQDPSLAAGSLIEAAILAQDLGVPEEAANHLTAVLEREPRDEQVAARLRSLLGEGAPAQLAQAYERVGASHSSDDAGAAAWMRAARIELRELNDPARAFSATGRALSRKADDPESLDLRIEAALASGHESEAALAIEQRLALPGASDDLRLRLGRLYAENLGEPEKALPLLLDRLPEVELPALVKLAPAARSLPPADSTRLLRRLLDATAAGKEPQPSRVHLAEWTDELARGLLALGKREEALEAFRKASALEPRNRAALRHVAELTVPDEAIAAHRTLFEMTPPETDSLHALFALFRAQGEEKAATACASVLVGLGLADAAEKAFHDEAVKRPPAELAPIDDHLLRTAGDEGAVRQLLAAASGDLARALPTQLAGRGDRVKGDNPVRRICAAIAGALGVAEPVLYVAKGEPGIVLATATDPPGLLVGLEVPKRYNPRQQRFLYARALGHIRRGTHPLAELPPARLGHLVGELTRLTAPAGTDFSRLPARDAKLGQALEHVLSPEVRSRLSPLAARAAAEAPAAFEKLALALRETAERMGLVLCGDPAAALSIVSAECPGGLERPEVARLARFAVSEAYLGLR